MKNLDELGLSEKDLDDLRAFILFAIIGFMIIGFLIGLETARILYLIIPGYFTGTIQTRIAPQPRHHQGTPPRPRAAR
jgi:hypothetical protein